MGNMSNPSIGRWGLNLFWYKFWFYDKNYYLSLQHDILINKLVYTFLNFGIMFPVNIFINKYWFQKYKTTNYFNNHNTKYYRIMGFKNLITKETNYYKERIKIENVYQSKIWILKYQNWVVINFYCYSPIKKRYLKNQKFKYNLRIDTPFLNFIQNQENYKRFKLILFYFFKKKNNINYFYQF